ncbi:DUF742 domain-containing protein [Amycolatopsis carbonis]|uniref:DUF742 domain-containing protein n=1 Tax=Amycolatopsis carbonis TaxID=715471 RepID=UPI003DA735EF
MRISGFGDQDTGAWDALHKGTDREGVDSPSHFELSTLKTMLPHRRPAASAVPPPAPVRPVAPAPAAPASSEYYDDDGYEWVEDGGSGYWEETGTSSGYYDAESYLTHEDRQVPEDSAYYQAPERRHLAAVEEPARAAGYEQDAAYASGYQRVPESHGSGYGHEQAPVSSDAAYASGYQQAPAADAYRHQAPASDAAYASGYHQAPASDAYALGYRQTPASDAYALGYRQAPASDAYALGYRQTPASDAYASGYQHAEPYASGHHHQLPAADAGYPADYNRSAAPESYPAENHRAPAGEYSSGYFEEPAYEPSESTGRHAVVAPSHSDQRGRRAAVDTADRDRPYRPTPADVGYLPPADAQHRLAEPPERTTGRRRAPEPVAPQQDSYPAGPYSSEPAGYPSRAEPYATEPVAAHQDQYPAEPYSPESEQAWSREDRAPAAKPAKSRVRPYARTRGRTRSDHNLALEALVSTSDDGRRYRGVRSIEHRRICDLCLDTRSVAEIAAHLHLPLGVVKILVGDMADIGLVLIHQTEIVLGDRSSRDFMERVLQGLRNL